MHLGGLDCLDSGSQSSRVDKTVNPKENEIIMEFGQLLRHLRSIKGVGIKKLAPDLGVTYSYISKLETGDAAPSEQFVERVSEYFHYDSNELLLAAGKVPADVLEILRSHPQDAVNFLRDRFGSKVDDGA
jgi:transcriptional regulator with XRE-family HTH domain